MKNLPYPPKELLFFLSFLEGGAVMVCELLSAKLLSPFFGTSLAVWAAVLGLTLGGLTVGYYWGGRLSKFYGKHPTLLYIILNIAGMFLIAMPFVSAIVMPLLLPYTLEWAAVISLTCFMVPPLICMGMVSPVIINLLTEDASSAGNSAGSVYAISTVGGILATFLLGFYIMPNFGLKLPAVVMGILLAIIPLYKLMGERYVRTVSVFLLMAASFSFLSFRYAITYNDEYKVLYESEGVLGQVKVVDHPSYGISSDQREGRALIVNNTLQTYIDKKDDLKYSLWSWSNYFPTAASIYPPGSKVLLLGLGGGTLVNQLQRLDFDVDVVEIDKRIWDVSIKYFGMDQATNCVIDDARHFIKTCTESYDIIIYDTFLSEAVPEHLLTLEGLKDSQKILKPNGLIMVNFYGAVKGTLGIAAASVAKTIQSSGFHVELLATPGSELNRNIIFLCSRHDVNFSNTRYSSGRYAPIDDLYAHFIDQRLLPMQQAVELTDDKPVLSKLYQPIARKWKTSYNKYYREHFMN